MGFKLKRAKKQISKVGKKYGKQIVSAAGDLLAPVTLGASKVVATGYVVGRTAKENKRAMERQERHDAAAEAAWLRQNQSAKSLNSAPVQMSAPGQAGAATRTNQGGVFGFFRRLFYGS